MPKKKKGASSDVDSSLELVDDVVAPKKKSSPRRKRTAPVVEDSSLDTDVRALLEEIRDQQSHIIRRSKMMFWFSVLRLFIILIPVIIGILYLPPLLEGIVSEYGEFIGGDSIDSLTTLLELLSSDKLDVLLQQL